MEQNKKINASPFSRKKRILKIVIILLALSFLVSFGVKSLVETGAKRIIEKLNNSSGIEKGRGFGYEKTAEELDREIKINSQNADLYNEKGNQYLLDKNFEKAIEEFNKAIEINPNYAEPYNGRGVAYRNLGKYYEATENYTKAIELYPSFFEAYNNRGVSFILLGDYDKACFDFSKSCELGSCQKLEISKQAGFCE